MKRTLRLTESDLTRIIRQVINEAHIDIPQNEILKAGVLLDMINSNIEKYKKYKVGFYSPIVDFKNFFKLNDNEGNPINISVGIYNDEDDFGLGRMDTENDQLLVNVGKWSEETPIGLKEFEDLITHELVHAIDPLVRKKDVYQSYFDKKGSDPKGITYNLSKSPNSKSEYEKEYDKYRKSQHEYKAELTPLINKLNKIVQKDSEKLKWIFWLVSSIGYYNNADELYWNSKEYFEKDGDPNFKFDQDTYWSFLFDLFNIIKPLSSKPSLFKKLKKELYIGLS